jgi:hypothetical protein
MSSGPYKPAAVCKRGHLITQDATDYPATPRCKECGAKVITTCPSCGDIVRGYHDVPYGYLDMRDYSPPTFCHNCGDPYPWAGRQARIDELQNRLDDQELDPADELVVREQLEALLDPDLDEEEQAKMWRRIAAKAPGFLQKAGVDRIVASLATAWIRKEAGLPP